MFWQSKHFLQKIPTQMALVVHFGIGFNWTLSLKYTIRIVALQSIIGDCGIG